MLLIQPRVGKLRFLLAGTSDDLDAHLREALRLAQSQPVAEPPADGHARYCPDTKVPILMQYGSRSFVRSGPLSDESKSASAMSSSVRTETPLSSFGRAHSRHRESEPGGTRIRGSARPPFTACVPPHFAIRIARQCWCRSTTRASSGCPEHSPARSGARVSVVADFLPCPKTRGSIS
jgi:hypothetical protein